jgi:hypothetical protein
MATSQPAVHFGIVVPQFDASWSQAREVAQAADESGFDSVWVVDHLVSVLNEAETVLESWTEITAIGAITRAYASGRWSSASASGTHPCSPRWRRRSIRSRAGD